MEVLGSACIRAGKFDGAREAFRKALSERPHSGFALYGIALSWDKQGKSEEAVRAYREFLDAWAYADRDLPPSRVAQAYLGNGSDEDVRGRSGGLPH
jgi:tetratricopeptide (TPR) repeat protein